jgi:hypothetical protein
MRSSFLYLAIITPSPAQGSLRSILCLSPAAIDLLKKKRARSPREGTRDHQGSLKSATNKVSLGLSPTSPSPTEYERPNKAPRGLGRGNTGAQNFARSVTSRGGRDASGSGAALGGEYRAAECRGGRGLPRGVPNIESVASPLPPLHCLLDYSTYTSVCGEKANLSGTKCCSLVSFSDCDCATAPIDEPLLRHATDDAR